MILNLQWPDVTMVTDEVRQCDQCGEIRTLNRMYRDLDDDGKYFCGKCAFWSPMPQEESENESQPAKRKATKKKQSKTSTEQFKGKPKKFVIVSFPIYKKDASKTPSKCYPKLQKRLAENDPHVLQKTQDAEGPRNGQGQKP